MEFEDVERRVEAALEMLNCADRALLHIDANERSITHKLAVHLQPLFRGWDVDCEYNRRGDKPKRFRFKPGETCLRKKKGGVFPDIIIHHRGHDRENLLVIEAKKSSSRLDTSWDKEKLRKFTSPNGGYNYAWGLLIIFDVRSEDAACELARKHKQEWFRDGEPASVEELSGATCESRAIAAAEAAACCHLL